MYRLIILLIVIYVAGLVIEYLRFPKCSFSELTLKLYTDIKKIYRAFKQPPQRHIFSNILEEQLVNIARPYANHNFDIETGVNFHTGTRFIYVKFIKNQKLSKEDLTELAELYRIKFRKYLQTYSLPFPHFICFSNIGYEVIFYIYFSEFPEDYEMFYERYRNTIAERSTTEYGILRDMKLDKELKKLERK